MQQHEINYEATRLSRKKVNIKTVQQSATRKKVQNEKSTTCKKCNTEKVQHEMSATRKKCNSKWVQHKALRKNVQHGKSTR